MLQRIDTEALKQDHPIANVVSRFGVALRPTGRTLVGRCPFHDDRGRPNFHVYPGSGSWYCFRCAEGGDAIRFVERIAHVGFRQAVELLDGPARPPHSLPPRTLASPRPRVRPTAARDPAERACLAAAVEVYHNRLLADPRALAYLGHRGLDPTTITTCRLGYAAGDELLAYLRWVRLPIQAALRVGLLGRNSREFLAGRLVVPEIRAGQPIWLIGRTIDPDDEGPKYLGLPGRKPLLGWEFAAAHREAWLVEGPFDYLSLRSMGLPVMALAGTHVRPETLAALGRFARLYLALDNDPAGRAATAHLAAQLGRRAIPITIPAVKDVAELARQPNGRARLLGTLGSAPLAA